MSFKAGQPQSITEGKHVVESPDLPPEVRRAVCKVLDDAHTARVSRDHNGRYHVHVEKIERVYISK